MEKRVALVTGGLSGIGKGTVLELSKKGYDVVIFDIETIAECRKYRSADFSIKEIDKIKHIDSLLQYVSILEQKQEYYKKQSLYFYKLIHKNNERIRGMLLISSIL